MCTEANKLKLVAQYYNNIQLMLDRILEVDEYVSMCISKFEVWARMNIAITCTCHINYCNL